MTDFPTKLAYTFAEAHEEHRAIDAAVRDKKITAKHAAAYKAEVAKRTGKD